MILFMSENQICSVDVLRLAECKCTVIWLYALALTALLSWGLWTVEIFLEVSEAAEQVMVIL